MKGKYSNERDAMLHRMSLEMWANDDSGDVESAQGFFSRLSNGPEEISEIKDAFSEGAPDGFEWDSLIGRFLVIEDSQGFVTVTEFRTDSQLEREFNRLVSAFHSDIDF